MSSFDDVMDRLNCPHRSDCSQYNPDYTVTAASRENKLSLDVECYSCRGRDHLMFDVGSHDRSNQTEFSVGDEFEVTESIRSFRNASVGDTVKITAIADNPLYSSEKLVVGVVSGINRNSPYAAHLFSLEDFKSLIGDSIEF